MGLAVNTLLILCWPCAPRVWLTQVAKGDELHLAVLQPAGLDQLLRPQLGRPWHLPRVRAARATHRALPHHAPSPRCTAEPVRHVWRRYTLHTQHPSGEQYADYLAELARAAKMTVELRTEVLYL